MLIQQSRLVHPVGMALLATVLATAVGCAGQSGTPTPGRTSAPETAAAPRATSTFPSERPDPSSVTLTRSSAAPAGSGSTSTSSTSTSSTSTSLASTSAECKAANLQPALGPRDAATGHVDSSIQFTNIGRAPCVISGFPGVSYVTGDSGRQVGAPAERDGASGPQVTLAPGQVASAPLRMTNAGMYEPDACQQTPVRGLRVYPPDDTDALFIAFDFDTTGCAGNLPTPQLRVRTVVAGTSG